MTLKPVEYSATVIQHRLPGCCTRISKIYVESCAYYLFLDSLKVSASESALFLSVTVTKVLWEQEGEVLKLNVSDNYVS